MYLLRSYVVVEVEKLMKLILLIKADISLIIKLNQSIDFKIPITILKLTELNQVMPLSTQSTC